MKLSFSLPSKPQPNLKKPSAAAASSSAAADGEESREFVTEFDSSKAPIDHAKNRIIPPKPNEWRPHKKMKNLDLPLQSDELGQEHPTIQFEVESSAPSVDPTSNCMSYGLNLRNSSNDDNDSRAEPNPSSMSNGDGDGDPLLHKLKEDLKRLPEDVVFDEFEDMPVEVFARALLAGYGWVEGRGIGRNAKEDVKFETASLPKTL